jgi:hypothetical protein
MLSAADRRLCEKIAERQQGGWFERRGIGLVTFAISLAMLYWAVRDVSAEPRGSLVMAAVAGFVIGTQYAGLFLLRERRILVELYRAAPEPPPPGQA